MKEESKVKEIRLSRRALKKLYRTAQENLEEHCVQMNFWIDQRNHWQKILRERYGLLA